MNLPAFAAAGALAILLTGGVALADNGAPATRSARAGLCSREATAKGLHGEARWKFRAVCEKAK